MSTPLDKRRPPISDEERATFRRFAREQLRDAAHWADVAGHPDVAEEIERLVGRLVGDQP